jgi:hypothetical protein
MAGRAETSAEADESSVLLKIPVLTNCCLIFRSSMARSVVAEGYRHQREGVPPVCRNVAPPKREGALRLTHDSSYSFHTSHVAQSCVLRIEFETFEANTEPTPSLIHASSKEEEPPSVAERNGSGRAREEHARDNYQRRGPKARGFVAAPSEAESEIDRYTREVDFDCTAAPGCNWIQSEHETNERARQIRSSALSCGQRLVPTCQSLEAPFFCPAIAAECHPYLCSRAFEELDGCSIEATVRSLCPGHIATIADVGRQACAEIGKRRASEEVLTSARRKVTQAGQVRAKRAAASCVESSSILDGEAQRANRTGRSPA